MPNLQFDVSPVEFGALEWVVAVGAARPLKKHWPAIAGRPRGSWSFYDRGEEESTSVDPTE